MNRYFSEVSTQMANKHMKRYSISLPIIETQNHNEISPHTSQDGYIKSTDNSKCW